MQVELGVLDLFGLMSGSSILDHAACSIVLMGNPDNTFHRQTNEV